MFETNDINEINEIKELEKRYEAYMNKSQEAEPKKKQKSKFLIYFLAFDIVATVVICVALYINGSASEPNIATNQTQTIINDTKEKIQQAKEKFDDSLKQEELANKIAERLEKNLKNSNQYDEPMLPKQAGRDSRQGWLKLNSEPISMPSIPSSEMVDFGASITPSTPQVAPVATPAPAPKKKMVNIEVTSSTKDDISALKDEFAKTNNATYALEIAKISFNKANYQDAIQWSLSANEIDNKIEESWVIFAKAKYKLNQKDDALRALKEYNKGVKKPSIDTLIKQIENDTL